MARPGLHIHDESNPTGMHRHEPGEALDGAHLHTPQNPGGEHIHGELSGQRLTDGWHIHENGGIGYHKHKEEDLGKNLNVVNPENNSSYLTNDSE